MKILLTGPFGNVGSNVVELVLKSNSSVAAATERVTLTCFDKKGPMADARYKQLEKSKLGKEALADGSLVVIWGDLTNAEDVQRAVQGQDAIIHLGAVIPPMAYILTDLARRVNVGGTKLLLDTCNKASQPRFIFASSYSVHGPKNPNRPVVLMTGETPLNAQDSYGSHKVECETMIRREYKGEWAILRLGAISVTLAGSVFTPASREMDMLTYGVPANQRRHGVHSKDVALAMLNAAKSPKVNGKTLMIGGDATWRTTCIGFHSALFSAIGLSFPELALRQPSPDADDAYYYEEWMDTTEAQELLQFQKHSLQSWRDDLRGEVGFVFYWVCRLFAAPIVRFFLARRSIHYYYNSRGLKDPKANKTMTQLVLEKD